MTHTNAHAHAHVIPHKAPPCAPHHPTPAHHAVPEQPEVVEPDLGPVGGRFCVYVQHVLKMWGQLAGRVDAAGMGIGWKGG
jgi:hypothetical protein